MSCLAPVSKGSYFATKFGGKGAAMAESTKFPITVELVESIAADMELPEEEAQYEQREEAAATL